MKQPPDDLPVYRALTGPDDAAFCQRVSEALALGYELHGSPAAAFDGHRIVLAQAVIWPAAKHRFPGISQSGGQQSVQAEPDSPHQQHG